MLCAVQVQSSCLILTSTGMVLVVSIATISGIRFAATMSGASRAQSAMKTTQVTIKA